MLQTSQGWSEPHQLGLRSSRHDPNAIAFVKNRQSLCEPWHWEFARLISWRHFLATLAFSAFNPSGQGLHMTSRTKQQQPSTNFQVPHWSVSSNAATPATSKSRRIQQAPPDPPRAKIDPWIRPRLTPDTVLMARMSNGLSIEIKPVRGNAENAAHINGTITLAKSVVNSCEFQSCD